MKAENIRLRDPFVLLHEGTYYLYGTRSETAFVGQAYGFDVYTSEDLTVWKGPFEVFRRPEDFFSQKSYWAPEVYFYDGCFYMFATFADRKRGLGTAVLRANSPMGPFNLWSDGYVTPKDWRCLDGMQYPADRRSETQRGRGKAFVSRLVRASIHQKVSVQKLCDRRALPDPN